MKIWLDLANSPQVLFFRPIIKELELCGHKLEITTRDYAQTVRLADQLRLRHQEIGRHGGKSFSGLAMQILWRSKLLLNWAKSRKFDLAVSHNSYSQVVAARLLGMPVITLMDYDHQPLNHLCFRLANLVIVPEPFPAEMIHKCGASNKFVKYAGIKEQLYLSDFIPDIHYREREGLPSDCSLVVIRPPAPWTAYHRFENGLFDKLLSFLASDNDRYLLFLPRLASQADGLRAIPNIHVASKVFDGPNLLYNADLVISGGGTMNRESAVLGTPTYTVFKGKLGAVDSYLIKQGRMIQISDLQDLITIRIEKKISREKIVFQTTLVKEVSEMIVNWKKFVSS